MPEPLRYPLKKLEQFDDYLFIEVLDYQPPGFGLQSSSSFALNTSDQTYANNAGKVLESVILPMPDNIQDMNGANWGKSEMGPINANFMSAISQGIREPNKIDEIAKDSLKKTIDTLNSGTGQNAITMGIAAAILNRARGEQLGGVLERGLGITFNQNVELVFNSVELRQGFTFNFNMFPRSKKESDQIKKIIRTFKKYSSARKGLDSGNAQGLFLKAPSVFRIKYMSGNKKHPFLHKFKICSLNNMGVNYTGGNTYATYADATPVNLIMSLMFRELTPIYYEDYLTNSENGSDDGIGVGY